MDVYTKLYNTRDDFKFHIVNGVYILKVIRYARSCSHYDDFEYRYKVLVDRLLSQEYEIKRLRNSSKKNLWQISRSHQEVSEVGERYDG